MMEVWVVYIKAARKLSRQRFPLRHMGQFVGIRVHLDPAEKTSGSIRMGTHGLSVHFCAGISAIWCEAVGTTGETHIYPHFAPGVSQSGQTEANE